MISHKNIPVIKLRRSFLKFHPNFDHGINSKIQCHILDLSCRQKTQRFDKSTDISPELGLFFCSQVRATIAKKLSKYIMRVFPILGFYCFEHSFNKRLNIEYFGGILGVSEKIIQQHMEECLFGILSQYIFLVLDLKLLDRLRCRTRITPFLRQLAKTVHNLILIGVLVSHGIDRRFVETSFGKHLLVDDEIG